MVLCRCTLQHGIRCQSSIFLLSQGNPGLLTTNVAGVVGLAGLDVAHAAREGLLARLGLVVAKDGLGRHLCELLDCVHGVVGGCDGWILQDGWYVQCMPVLQVSCLCAVWPREREVFILRGRYESSTGTLPSVLLPVYLSLSRIAATRATRAIPVSWR